ncbi:hypothetical protein ACFWIO_21390 [Streptomyces diastatochromogenes]|uniref:hypothetical protein n=1 Tax=Streptomyces diastatochromogenes TaxID=42236 RepID=UPI003666039D
MKEGELHYIVVGDGGQGSNTQITAWGKKHGTAVKSSAYSSTSTSTSSGLYRLDPSDVS